VANTYVSGSLVQVATYAGTVASPIGGFRDNNGNLADPSIVILKYKPGAKSMTVTVQYPTAPIVKDSIGLYRANLDTTGQIIPIDEWIYEWIGTGSIQAAGKGIFEVTQGL
jgi:hypothetical protein